MIKDSKKTRSKISIWGQALRAFSFSASMIPVLLAAALAVGQKNVRWQLLPLVVLGVLLLHAGANLISDAADFQRGVDRKGAFGGSGVLVDGLLTLHQVFFAGIFFLSLGAIIGFILFAICGMPVFYLGIAGVIGGFGYGARPFGFKYAALGDLIIFILFGLLISYGSYFVLTGILETKILLASLPLAFLVTAIVQSNNLRDILTDREAGIKTIATTIGDRFSRLEYHTLLILAYLTGILLVFSGILPAGALLFFFSIPLALKNIKMVQRSSGGENAIIAKIDVETAKLHMVFGILTIGGILIKLFL